MTFVTHPLNLKGQVPAVARRVYINTAETECKKSVVSTTSANDLTDDDCCQKKVLSLKKVCPKTNASKLDNFDVALEEKKMKKKIKMKNKNKKKN